MRVELRELVRHRLLGLLPEPDRRRLLAWSDLVHLSRGETVHEPGALIDYMYFPLSAVFSLFGITLEGETVALCDVGTEGVVGMSTLSWQGQTNQHAMLQTNVQIPGTALRTSAQYFTSEESRQSPLYPSVTHYLDMFFSNLILGATCNRHHSLERRCIRWLLSTQDRIGGQEIRTTQESLAQILGVRRQSIDAVMGTLGTARLIACRRGQITILDRQILSSRVCECYGIAARRLREFADQLSPIGEQATA